MSGMKFSSAGAQAKIQNALERSAKNVPAVVRWGGDLVVQVAKQLTPHDTGALEDAITSSDFRDERNRVSVKIFVDGSQTRIKDGKAISVSSYMDAVNERYHKKRPGPGTVTKARSLATRAGGKIANPETSRARWVTEWFLLRAINITAPKIRERLKAVLR